MRPTYLSAQVFLAALPGLPDCLIVDLQMPEMSGLELQLTLTRLTANPDHRHHRAW